MKLLVFDLRGDLAHFRRPDTTATHASYPFITRTALRGLLGSILGLEHWADEAWTGVQLLHPVVTRTQKLSLLSKYYLGSGGSKPTDPLNRPTSLELVIRPHYRIFYYGERFDELHAAISQGLAVYHTYLGSAFAPTKPRFVDLLEAEEATPEQSIDCLTIVPSHVVTHIEIQPGHQYVRAGGVPYHSLGERHFEGTMNFIYERSGQPMRFTPTHGEGVPVRWFKNGQGWINLW
jgi:CRISPR-associated protein Cas5h